MNAVVALALAVFWLSLMLTIIIIPPDEACSLFYSNGPLIFSYGNFRISEYTLISFCEWEGEKSVMRFNLSNNGD